MIFGNLIGGQPVCGEGWSECNEVQRSAIVHRPSFKTNPTGPCGGVSVGLALRCARRAGAHGCFERGTYVSRAIDPTHQGLVRLRSTAWANQVGRPVGGVSCGVSIGM